MVLRGCTSTAGFRKVDFIGQSCVDVKTVRRTRTCSPSKNDDDRRWRGIKYIEVTTNWTIEYDTPGSWSKGRSGCNKSSDEDNLLDHFLLFCKDRRCVRLENDGRWCRHWTFPHFENIILNWTIPSTLIPFRRSWQNWNNNWRRWPQWPTLREMGS